VCLWALIFLLLRYWLYVEINARLAKRRLCFLVLVFVLYFVPFLSLFWAWVRDNLVFVFIGEAPSGSVDAFTWFSNPYVFFAIGLQKVLLAQPCVACFMV